MLEFNQTVVISVAVVIEFRLLRRSWLIFWIKLLSTQNTIHHTLKILKIVDTRIDVNTYIHTVYYFKVFHTLF